LQQVSAPSIQKTPSIPQTNALELKDIHVPEQISGYPVAYGWWLLAALLILVAVVGILKVRKKAKRNQVKKQALAQIRNSPNMTTSDTVALLKWAAMHYFSRAELAKLFGDSLQKFLSSQLPIKHQKNFTDLSEQAFLNQYIAQPKASKNTDDHAKADEDFNQSAVLWLTHALPPKAVKIMNTNASLNSNENQGVST